MERLVPNVRCPRCSAVAKAAGTHAVCGRCGLTGRIGGAKPTGDSGEGPSPAAPATAAKPGADEKHPLQFTIDLRKVSPAYWSGGTKATAVLLLLVGAFALGGFAGIAFEKTRNDLDAGIDDVKALPGGQQGSLSDGGALANNDSNLGGASTETPATGTNTAEDPPDDPDPAADPEPNGTEEEPGGEGAPSGQERTVLAENGVGEWESAAFTTEAPLLQIDVDYWGDRFFVLKFLQEGEVKPAATVSASDQGDYVDKTRYISLPPGNYTVRVDLGAGDVEDGPWNLAVTEPVPDQALDPGVPFSDRGDSGVGPVRLTGEHTFSFYSSTQGAAHAKVYTAAGVRLNDCSMSGTATSTEPVDETATCSVDGETWVFIDVAARTSADGSVKWRLEIE